MKILPHAAGSIFRTVVSGKTSLSGPAPPDSFAGIKGSPAAEHHSVQSGVLLDFGATDVLRLRQMATAGTLLFPAIYVSDPVTQSNLTSFVFAAVCRSTACPAQLTPWWSLTRCHRAVAGTWVKAVCNR